MIYVVLKALYCVDYSKKSINSSFMQNNHCVAISLDVKESSLHFHRAKISNLLLKNLDPLNNNKMHLDFVILLILMYLHKKGSFLHIQKANRWLILNNTIILVRY